MSDHYPHTAIVDYGMGNLFSIRQACEQVGLPSKITSLKEDILTADAVILPGVGAFGDAMQSLKDLDLVTVLRDVAERGTPFMGICLGMQLMMSVSYEFGTHQGLDVIKGEVIKFKSPKDHKENVLKVPQVAWNTVYRKEDQVIESWELSLLNGLKQNSFMYFVHSYYVVPENKDITLSYSRYGDIEFCSSMQIKNIFTCQFHPERSAKAGLRVYENLKRYLLKAKEVVRVT